MQGKEVWSEFAPILGDGKKGMFGANICQRGLCQMRVESLKSPQCGDFLPAPVKKDWRSFACCETEKEKIVLGTSGFAKCAGTDAMERKEHFYERRIPKTAIYRMAV